MTEMHYCRCLILYDLTSLSVTLTMHVAAFGY